MQTRSDIPPEPEASKYSAAYSTHAAYRFLGSGLLFSLLLLVAACGPAVTVNQIKPQQTVTIDKAFQTQATPLPTIPPYRCGAWASNNAPNAFSTILILAKLTKDIQAVAGATATATVHFQGGDMPLTPQTSDQGGTVSFTLPLQGQQPKSIPATVDVSFAIGGATVVCSAFFTPQ